MLCNHLRTSIEKTQQVSKMKGLTLAKPGAPYVLVSDLEKPTPGPKQVLVKSLYTGINPV
jgi:hypothetical protein